LLLAGGRAEATAKTWEIQLAQIAVALGDENLASGDATRTDHASRCLRRAAAMGHRLQAMKSQKERSEERRKEKLEEIQEQVDRGELSIRQMTPKERKENPPRERKPRGSR
jgi:anti-sigma28 factor (negative regulator of flagellin synthesis)